MNYKLQLVVTNDEHVECDVTFNTPHLGDALGQGLKTVIDWCAALEDSRELTPIHELLSLFLWLKGADDGNQAELVAYICSMLLVMDEKWNEQEPGMEDADKVIALALKEAQKRHVARKKSR